MIKTEKIDKKLWFILLFFLLLYASISLVNHYFFRTYAWDLGIYTNALFDYSHFKWNECTLLTPHFENVLADHFTLYPIIVSPFVWIFGSYTMLIFQICMIQFGGYGVYRYIQNRTSDENIPLYALIHFFFSWAIFSSLAFDYHDNVVAAMLVPWLFLTFEQAKWKPFFLLVFLFLISKENMALWGIFLFLGIALSNYREKEKLKIALLASVISLLYFILIIQFVMPALGSGSGQYHHLKYSILGDSFTSIITTLFTEPFTVIKYLFVNHAADTSGDGLKMRLHLMVLFTGGWALLVRPSFLIMLIPIYFQKMFNDDLLKWGPSYHYSIEFIPIISIALFSCLDDIINVRLQKWLVIGSITAATITTFSYLDSPPSKWYDPGRHRFYQAAHYSRTPDVKTIRALFRSIPKDAIVSAESCLIPHLAFRDKIYLFPEIADATYVIVMPGEKQAADIADLYQEMLDSLENNEHWEKLTTEAGLLLFRKKN